MYHVGMSNDLLEQARKGDYTGMRFVILSRMSNESKRRKRAKERKKRTAPKYRTGLDIDTRARQVERCRADIESRGGTVVCDDYSEPHTSAYKRVKMKDAEGNTIYRVIRPVYQQVLKDLMRGVAKNGESFDAIMCADPDRWTRDPRDLEDAIDAVMHCKRPVVELTHTFDLSTRYGQQGARNLVNMKNAQSADSAQRVRDMHETLQLEGIPTGGTRPFGWNEDKRTLHPTESKLFRKAINEILKGRSRASICAEWNKQGILTPLGNKWRPTNFVKMLRNPRVAGYRMVTVPRDPADPDSPKIVVIKLGPNGKPVKGQWTAMTTPAKWRALLEIIGEAPQAAQATNTRGTGLNARKYLGTGTLRCSKCEHPLRGTKAPKAPTRPPGFFWYTCPPKSSGGCGGTKVNGPEADEAIREIVVSKWEQEAAARKAAPVKAAATWGREAELERVYENMAALKAAHRAGQISPERYYADLGEYEAEERALTNEQNAFVRESAQSADRPVNLRKDWPTLTLVDRRGYMEKALSAIIVTPSEQRGLATPAAKRLKPIPVETRKPRMTPKRKAMPKARPKVRA